MSDWSMRMCNDVMEFPKTPEEFCVQYSFFFDKDEVYTNGVLLIPVYRVEQMIDHYFERTCENVGEETDFACSECGSRLYIKLRGDYTMILEDGVTLMTMPNYCPNCGAKVEKIVQITHCRDCKYYEEKTYKWTNDDTRIKQTCAYFDDCSVEPDGYCAWAKEKSGNE